MANESWCITMEFPKIYWRVAGTMKYYENLIVLNKKELF
jgi:hypothetical protein